MFLKIHKTFHNHRILKRLAKALIRLHLCAGWSEALLVAHTLLLEISCTGWKIRILCMWGVNRKADTRDTIWHYMACWAMINSIIEGLIFLYHQVKACLYLSRFVCPSHKSCPLEFSASNKMLELLVLYQELMDMSPACYGWMNFLSKYSLISLVLRYRV